MSHEFLSVPGNIFGSFFALMPGDNAATVALGGAVDFPQDGPASGITRLGVDSFELPSPGTYKITWQVSVDEPGQLQVQIDGAPVLNTTAGRATGTSQIVNSVMVTVAGPNSILEIINPPGNAAALTITPTAGGTNAVSAWLLIEKM